MKAFFAALFLLVASVHGYDKPSSQDLAMDVFFKRLNPQPMAAATSNKAESSGLNIAPLDIAYIMDKVGATLVVSIQKVVDHFMSALGPLLIDLLKPTTKTSGSWGIFDDKADFMDFGRQLQTLSDRLFTQTKATHSIESDKMPKFNSPEKQEIFNLLASWLVQVRLQQVSSSAKPDVLSTFARIAAEKQH